MPKQGYHHGNLRQALVDAALREAGVRAPVLRIAKAPARKRKS